MIYILHFNRKLFTIEKSKKWLKEKNFKFYELVGTNKKDYIFAVSENYLGGGLISEIKRYYEGIKMAIKGNRDNLKPSVRKILEQNKNAKIANIKICRTPLTSKFKTIISYINKFTNFKGDNIDNLFHLFLILTLDNGNVYTLEKNQDINLQQYIPTRLDEIVDTGKGLDITMAELLENTRNKIGNDNFYIYNAFSLNCQRFVIDVLESNNIDTTNLKSFILQKVDNLVPKWGEKLAKFVTDFANRSLTIIQGKGSKK